MLTQKALEKADGIFEVLLGESYLRVPCFIGTKVQILTQKALKKADGIFEVLLGERPNLQFHITMLRARIKLKAGEVRSLLALLVQKYKYCCWAGERTNLQFHITMARARASRVYACNSSMRLQQEYKRGGLPRASRARRGRSPLLYYCCRRILLLQAYTTVYTTCILLYATSEILRILLLLQAYTAVAGVYTPVCYK
jgi:hypothetical protein